MTVGVLLSAFIASEPALANHLATAGKLEWNSSSAKIKKAFVSLIFLYSFLIEKK